MSVKRDMWLMCPCGCEEYSQKTVVEHMERVHPEMLFKCNVNQCGRLFWKLYDLKKHIEKSDNHRNFRQNHENLFNVEEFLDKQSRSYTRQFLGLKVTNSKLAMDGLIEYPVDLKEYRCRVCKANKTHFSSFLWSCVILHVRNIHPSKPSSLHQIKYKCRECGSDDFNTERSLQSHIDEKHGLPLQMSAESRLHATIKTDSESEIQITEVKCVSSSRVCNSTTESWYESLVPQQRGPPLVAVPTENGEGDTETCHPCSFCKLRIPESQSSFHLKIHYDELFKCDICQLGFEEYGKVVQHLKTIHKVGERCRGLIGLPMQTRSLTMLKCGIEDCDRKFIGQQNEMDIMMKHITKSHEQYDNPVNNVKFFCRICEDLETYDSLNDVVDHIKYKHRRQLVTLNSSSEEDNEKVFPLPQRYSSPDEPPRKVIIIEEPRKCTIKENKHNHQESRRNAKPSRCKQQKAKKREKKKYRKDDNDNAFKVKSKPHAITKLRSSKNSKTRSRLNKLKCQPKWPQLIKEVPTAAIKELLENVTTATIVASTIEKKLKRNKTKSESKSHYSKSKSSATETSTNSESETEGDSETDTSYRKDSTSNSDEDTREESSKLQKRRPKTKININSALLKRMNNNITLEERLAYCLGKYKPEEKISQITGETLGKNKLTIPDNVADRYHEMQGHTELQLSDRGEEDSESGVGKVRAVESGEKELKMAYTDEDDQMSKHEKEWSTPGQRFHNLKDREQCLSADGEILKQSKESATPPEMPAQDKTFKKKPKQTCLEKIFHKPSSTILYCEFCPRQFPDAFSICGHIYKDHGPLLFRCKICTNHDMLVSGFVSTRGLVNHLQKGHGWKGMPNQQLLGNESLVELPDKFLQKIVCVRDGCKGSTEIGRSGLWLGRDLANAKAQIVEHNLFRHKTVTVGDKIELRCRVCPKFCEGIASKERRWRTHCAQNHFKLLNLKSGLDRKKIF